MTTAPICLPYFSGHGHTLKLAQGIAAGLTTPRLIDVEHITQADWDALDEAPAILFGTPTYMGSVAARYALFLEEAAERWDSQAWADKLAGGFTVGSYPAGDKLSALMRLAVYAAQMGMIWIGPNEIGAPVHPERPGIDMDGSMLGLSATSSRDKDVLIEAGYMDTARLFGDRVQRAVARWG